MYRFCLLVTLLVATNLSNAQEVKYGAKSFEKSKMEYDVFGEKIDNSNSITSAMMYEKYSNLKTSDSLKTKFSAKVLDVCKAKGCWMRLALDNGEEAMVKFKDYGFFVPLDITGREVVVNGSAFVNAVSVEEQKHYAKDGGKSQEEIDKITTPKKTYGFLADGVLLKK
ncbi:DUF4920 domain-containing protein [Aurantibacter sp.]|uniref:DUF4920 domain-containing protein n=1 Tax=Aurantibacter sp. TaxID=2807103 RepID=UPI00326466FC